MASSYSDSGTSDQEILEAQSGARKRRKLSPTGEDESQSDTGPAPPRSISTISRIKAKKADVAPAAANGGSKAASIATNSQEQLGFASINVAPWLVASLSSMEIKKPTGIQKACIPEILKGRDCIGGSRTGTGKTVAFSVPILQKWAEDPCGIFALIIT